MSGAGLLIVNRLIMGRRSRTIFPNGQGGNAQTETLSSLLRSRAVLAEGDHLNVRRRLMVLPPAEPDAEGGQSDSERYRHADQRTESCGQTTQ